jgi:hypothetical protein
MLPHADAAGQHLLNTPPLPPAGVGLVNEFPPEALPPAMRLFEAMRDVFHPTDLEWLADRWAGRTAGGLQHWLALPCRLHDVSTDAQLCVCASRPCCRLHPARGRSAWQPVQLHQPGPHPPVPRRRFRVAAKKRWSRLAALCDDVPTHEDAAVKGLVVAPDMPLRTNRKQLSNNKSVQLLCEWPRCS